jgi:hypothetical protein
MVCEHVVASMGPRNAYKDMLDNVGSLITCVSMNHQNQLEQMANGAMFVLGGYPKNSDDSPNTRERVLNTFKHKVRAQRDCGSLYRLHKFPKF